MNKPPESPRSRPRSAHQPRTALDDYLLDPSTDPLPWPDQKEMFIRLIDLRRQAWSVLLESSSFCPLVLERVGASAKTELPDEITEHLTSVYSRIHLRTAAAAWCDTAEPSGDLLRSTVKALEDAMGNTSGDWPPPGTRRPHAAWLRRCRRAVDELDDLRSHLAITNLRLSIGVAASRANQGGLSFSDLVNEAFVGLLRAVDRFDVSRGLRFSTYALWWVRQSIRRSIQERGRLVRLPCHLQEDYVKLRKLEADLGDDIGAIAERMGMSIKRVQKLQRTSPLFGSHLSLDRPVYPDENDAANAVDFLVDDQVDIEQETLASEERLVIRQHLARLPPFEREILSRRFGIDSEVHTLREIAEDHGLSRERIRQRETGALEMLRGLIAAGKISADVEEAPLLPTPPPDLCQKVLTVLEDVERLVGCMGLAARVGVDPWLVRRACVNLVREGRAIQVGRRFRYAPPRLAAP